MSVLRTLNQRISSGVRRLDLIIHLTLLEVPSNVQLVLPSPLRAVQERVAQREFALQRNFDDLQSEERQSHSISERLAALAEDLRQYQDTKRLQSFGSQQGLNLGEGNCPTCHQSITDSLLPQDTLQQVMTVEENIDFIKAQIAVFQTMERDNVRIVAAKRSQVAALREEVSELRERVRSVRTSLISDARLPSIAALQERVNLETRIKRGERTQQEFETLLIRLGETSGSWRDVESRLAALPPGDLTETDENKLKTLERSFRNQLRTYGLSSTSPDTLAVSRENYKPIHEGFDIEFNNSASDLIRTLWAYYTALLETSVAFGGNHPGLLILDEPRQQSTARQSFGTFLRHLADPSLAAQQVIVATSEEDAVLKTLLEGQTFQYIDFEGKILRRLPESG